MAVMKDRQMTDEPITPDQIIFYLIIFHRSLTGGDPERDHYGCFLSDLTGFAGAPPATSRKDYDVSPNRAQGELLTVVARLRRLY
jgi:hypothetical protein